MGKPFALCVCYGGIENLKSDRRPSHGDDNLNDIVLGC